MQRYPVRTTHRANLTLPALEGLLRTHFDAASTDGTTVSTSYGAIERLAVRPDGRTLVVDVRMNPKVPDETARATIERYNRFLQESTGYNAKERARRLRQSVGSAPAGA